MNDRTLFEGIDKRIRLGREDSDSAYFETLSFKLEYLTKLVTVGLIACIGDDRERHRYSMEHKLVRANSLGEWVHVLNNALTGPASSFLLPKSRIIAKELTERTKPQDWRHKAVTELNHAAISIGSDGTLGHKIALHQFFDIALRFRNRSRGHGATNTDQKSRAIPHLLEAILALTEKLSLFKIGWAYLHRNQSGKYRVSPLTGDTSKFSYLKSTNAEKLRDGVYIYLDCPERVNLLFSDPELHDIGLPNGGHKKGQFETLSYITNKVVSQDGGDWATTAGNLPPSETDGSRTLEPFGLRSFANVPPVLDDYIPRPDFVNIVMEELLEIERHPILSLTGPGGIGKTTLTIAALHEIKNRTDMPYEVVLWISARDIDLLDSGAKSVKPRVINKEDISREVVELLDPSERDLPGFNETTYFERCLRYGAAGATLFVLDNFETVQRPVDVYAWLDTHIRLPNKLVITTRIREFRADLPVEISGMTSAQADQLIDQHSTHLQIRDFVSSSYKRKLISESEGHPYVMKIMLGQVAALRKEVDPKRIMASSDHILRALFERTYSELNPAAQRAFLLLSRWRVLVPEIAIQAVLLRNAKDRLKVDEAIEQLYRFSLVHSRAAEEQGHRMVVVPLAASIFGCAKLETSEYRISVQEDLKLLMDFGPGWRENSSQQVLPRIKSLYGSVAKRAQRNSSVFDEYRPFLEFLAEKLPIAFKQLSELAWSIDDSITMRNISIGYLRRYLEVPDHAKKEHEWRRLAKRCRAIRDVSGEIHATCEAALVSSKGVDRLSGYASRLNSRLRDMKADKNGDVWSPHVSDMLRRVTKELEDNLAKLSASDCCQLGWLYMHLNDRKRARYVAQVGLEREPNHEFIQRLISAIDGVN